MNLFYVFSLHGIITSTEIIEEGGFYAQQQD